MNIVSFIEPTQPDVIQKIITDCGLADEPPRAPPNAPPPENRELRYVTDLDFVQEPTPGRARLVGGLINTGDTGHW